MRNMVPRTLLMTDHERSLSYCFADDGKREAFLQTIDNRTPDYAAIAKNLCIDAYANAVERFDTFFRIGWDTTLRAHVIRGGKTLPYKQ